MKLKIFGAVVAMAAGVVVVAPGQAFATSPQRYTESEHVHEVVGGCGAGDNLVADYTVTESVTLYAAGSVTLHLELVGTITRTGTGVVAKYAERQKDFFDNDGSEKYVGVLAHLVVPGGHGFTLAGQAQVSPEGDLTTTPHLAPLLDLDFEAALCDALVR